MLSLEPRTVTNKMLYASVAVAVPVPLSKCLAIGKFLRVPYELCLQAKNTDDNKVTPGCSQIS